MMLHPCEWSSVRFQVKNITPSKNTTNWKSMKGKMAAKKKWRGIFQAEMEKLELPKPIPRMKGTPLICMVTIRFTPASRNPETRNYVPSVEECLADALRHSENNNKVGWIEDDRDDDVEIYVSTAKERGERGMLIELRWMEPETPDGPVSSAFYESDNGVAALPS